VLRERSELYSLQLLDAVAWSAVEHSIAVVDSGQDKTTSQCLCQYRSQQMSNVSDGLCMVLARSRHRRDVQVKVRQLNRMILEDVELKTASLGFTLNSIQQHWKTTSHKSELSKSKDYSVTQINKIGIKCKVINVCCVKMLS